LTPALVYRYRADWRHLGTRRPGQVGGRRANVGVAVVDVLGLDKSWDLIVGVDGYRVKNIFELMHELQDIQSGDRVYLAIVRKGQRMLIVLVP
jgi:S1-C subfamily serine protease